MELMNSKTEFNHPPIPRITVEGKSSSKKKKGTELGKPKLNPGTLVQCPIETNNDISSLSGTEVAYNHRQELLSHQKQLSSEQDNHIESTMLKL